MRRTVIFATAMLISGSVHAQTRPQWQSHYNGHGFTPGYSYNPRSGWNTMTSPNGNMMHYRDGYVPLQPGVPRNGYGPGYNNNSSPRYYNPEFSPKLRRYKSKYYSTEPIETGADILGRLGG